MIIYRIENIKTGLYWNGNVFRSKFEQYGGAWKSLDLANRALKDFIKTLISKKYSRSHSTNFLDEFSFADLAVREIEIKEIKLSPIQDSNIIFHSYMEEHLANINYEFVYFYKKMLEKKVIDNIEFIFALKPENNTRYISMSQIKTARAKLRQLKIKTRTFREHRGMFGFYNRDQAMKARLTLDVKNFIDLSAERAKVREQLPQVR
jgi:hypothetical protein